MAVTIAADISRAVAVAGLATAAALSQPHLIFLGPGAIVLGVGEGVAMPASFAILPEVVAEDRLQVANGLTSAALQLGGLAGPALGGLIIAVSSAATAFAVDAASFWVSALVLSTVAVRATVARPNAAAPATSAADGEASFAAHVDATGDEHVAETTVSEAPTLRSLLRSEPVLRLVLVVNTAANLGTGAMSEVALPSLAHGAFRSGATGYGLILAALAAGGVVGALAAMKAASIARPAIAGSFTLMVAGSSVAFVPFLGGTIGAALMMSVFGSAVAFGNVVLVTALQRWAPRDALGRVMGAVMLTSLGLFPISVVLGGVLVRVHGPSVVFPIAGGIMVGVVAVALTQATWRHFGAIN